MLLMLANFNRKEHLRHRAVSLRQHGFLVISMARLGRHSNRLAGCNTCTQLSSERVWWPSKQPTVNCLNMLSLLLNPDYTLPSIAVENLGCFDLSTSSFFLSNLGNKIHTWSCEDKMMYDGSFFSAYLFLYNILILCFARLFHRGRSDLV